MSRLEEIYQRTFNELPEGRGKDEELAEKIKEALLFMDCPGEEQERIEEAMFTGSSIGQAHGFYTGFRFAIGLLFESLVD